MVANGKAASGVSPGVTSKILRQAAAYADLLILCEVHNVRVQAALGLRWRVLQLPGLGSSASGVAVAVAKDRGAWADPGHHESRRTQPFLNGRRAANLRERLWVGRRVLVDPGTRYQWTHPFSSGHAPPMRAWFLWAKYMLTMPRKGTAGADFNKGPEAVRKHLAATSPGRRLRQRELLGLAVPRWIPVGEAQEVEIGSDHPGVLVELWPEVRQ